MVYRNWNGVVNTIYTVDIRIRKVVAAFGKMKEAVNWIDSQPVPSDFANYSRYALAKDGLYPKTKAGNYRLEQDLANWFVNFQERMEPFPDDALKPSEMLDV